ncbi:MAG: hypothetical protein JWP91_643 [Fibrobacteres bacterium]|nr:hypothetical protein [Fibrobacterota bacterium]
MSALKLALLLPLSILSSALAWNGSGLAKRSGSASPSQMNRSATAASLSPDFATIPITKTDVQGFWSYNESFGLDIHIMAEIFFAADGSFETRIHTENDGETMDGHQFGTWTLKKDTLTITPNGDCISLGMIGDEDPCADTTSDLVTIGKPDGVKALILDDGSEFGRYAGPGKAFTLPNLFANTALAAPGNGKATRSRPGISLSGGRGGEGMRAFSGFDATGRSSGPRRAAGFSVIPTEKH